MKFTAKEEREIAEAVYSEEKYEQLAHLGDWITIDDMVSATIGHSEEDFRRLISNGILKSIKKDGEICVQKDSYVDWFSQTIPQICMDEVRDYHSQADDSFF